MDLEFNILAAEQTTGSVQRLFVTSGYDVLVLIEKEDFSKLFQMILSS